MESIEGEMGLGLRFALSLSRLLGIRPLCQQRGSILWTCVYKTHAISSFVLIIFLSVMSIFSFVIDVKLDMKNATRLVFVSETRPEFFLWLIHLAMVVIVVNFGAWTARGRLIRIQKLYTKENLKIKNKKWQEMKRIAVSLLVLWIVIIFELKYYKMLINAIMTGDTKVFDFCLLGANETLFIISTALILEFMFLIYAFHAAMVSVNEELIGIFINFSKIRPLTSVEEANVRRISTKYISIGLSVDEFNKTDGRVLLLILIYLYLDLITCIYRNIDTILRFATFNFESIMWLFIYTGTIIGIFEPCHQFQKEVERLRQVMAKLMYRCTLVGQARSSVIQVFSDQLEAITPAFSPLGVCTLTRSLLLTAMSATITGLVFIVQSRINKSNGLPTIVLCT